MRWGDYQYGANVPKIADGTIDLKGFRIVGAPIVDSVNTKSVMALDAYFGGMSVTGAVSSGSVVIKGSSGCPYVRVTPAGTRYQAVGSVVEVTSADGFSHVVPKTLGGTVFSDEATVSAGGVKLTSHEFNNFTQSVADVVSESAPSSIFFRRCAVDALESENGFPHVEENDCTGSGTDLSGLSPTKFSLDVSGLFHNDGGRLVDGLGHEDALVRAVYNATGAMFVQPDVDGSKDNLDKPYVRRNEVTADGMYLVKPNYTYEDSALLRADLFNDYEDVDRFVASVDSSSCNLVDNPLDPYFYYKDRHGMPTMLHNFAYGHDYANLTAARLLFRRDEKVGASGVVDSVVFGGMSAEMVKFYGAPSGASGPKVDDLEHSSALSSQWLRVQRFDEDASGEGDEGYVYSRVEADGLIVGNSVSGVVRTTVKMGETRLTSEGNSASLTPAELKLYAEASESTATMTPAELKLYAEASESTATMTPAELKLYVETLDTPYITVGTEAADRVHTEASGLNDGHQAFIAAPGGLMLRIGTKELYLTEEKLETLSSVLDDYEAANKDLEEIA